MVVDSEAASIVSAAGEANRARFVLPHAQAGGIMVASAIRRR